VKLSEDLKRRLDLLTYLVAAVAFALAAFTLWHLGQASGPICIFRYIPWP